MSKSKPIVFDVVGAVILFFLTVLAALFVNPEKPVTTILALISFNAAIIAGRLRIHIDHKVGELNDKLTEHIRLFAPGKVLGDLLEMKIIRNTNDVNELVKAFGKACDNLKEIIEFVYRIELKHQLYKHDIEKIKRLRSGETYRATHSFAVMSEIWNGNRRAEDRARMSELKDEVKEVQRVEFDESAIFAHYMNAQYEARKRGVKITRIYIVDEVDKVLQDERVRQHFKEMCDHKIDAKIITRKYLTEGYNEDFIIIGNKLLGLGQTDHGSVTSAEYHFNSDSSKEKFDDYLAYFEALEKIAVDYKEFARTNQFSRN
jgi:hypothetical protein